MKRRTKIVCTIGPAVATREKLKGLIAAGMNVARLNCSHGDWETRREWVQWIRELSPTSSPIAILADLQGPKFRIGELGPEGLMLATGATLTIGPGEDCTIPVFEEAILDGFTPGARILLGDGNVELKIVARSGRSFDAKVVTGGAVKSRQGITVVGRVFDVPSLTEKDLQDVYESAKLGVDFIALSYVRTSADIRSLRRVVEKYDPSISICAKIETRDALRDIDEIIRASDLIMVARGDLGLQMDIEDVPIAQKKIIQRCATLGVPVITATQMLESMVTAPRPTRAEATDIANAILDGTDAVMLSGETAVGAFPLEAVGYMARISEKAEAVYDAEQRVRELCEIGTNMSHTEAVAHAVAQLAATIKPKAIVTTTTSGQTARLVSKFRPRSPILCATWNPKTQAQMAVVWGVEAVSIPLPNTTDEIIANAIDGFLKKKRLKFGDLVIVTAGVPAGTPGNTNLILTQIVR
jgi:pyruvate kinase